MGPDLGAHRCPLATVEGIDRDGSRAGLGDQEKSSPEGDEAGSGGGRGGGGQGLEMYF